jgi:hypothetical protein
MVDISADAGRVLCFDAMGAPEIRRENLNVAIVRRRVSTRCIQGDRPRQMKERLAGGSTFPTNIGSCLMRLAAKDKTLLVSDTNARR